MIDISKNFNFLLQETILLTAELLWHVQICDLIGSLKLKLMQKMFSMRFQEFAQIPLCKMDICFFYSCLKPCFACQSVSYAVWDKL